jgi:hypothetical protein
MLDAHCTVDGGHVIFNDYAISKFHDQLKRPPAELAFLRDIVPNDASSLRTERRKLDDKSLNRYLANSLTC